MKTVLVTGGNRGIGLEVCKQLSEKGHQVIMGSRDIRKGFKAAANLNSNVHVMQLDVTDDLSVRKLIKSVSHEFKKLDVLINNAGVGTDQEVYGNALFNYLKSTLKKQLRFAIKPLMPVRKAGLDLVRPSASFISLDSVQSIFNTNFLGAWRMIQATLPLLRQSEDARIINVSSGRGSMEEMTGVYPGYSVSKHALNALTCMFANELEEYSIKVNSVCPGWVRTEMGGPHAPMSVEQGADTIVWLATEETVQTGKFFREREEISW